MTATSLARHTLDARLRELLILGLSPEKAAERVPGATTADAARIQRAMQAARTGTPTEGAAAIKAGRT